MFDPLGWLAPIIIVAKIVMQDLWAICLDRDDELPSELTNRWRNLAQQLEDMTTISIPRWLGTSNSAIALELHGFSDASQRAPAAVICLRVLRELDDARVTLICAKTKVAPLKNFSIPRLELSAAVLLVGQIRLMPILDSNGLLRLRGRLQLSKLDPAEKHPLILPRDSRLTTLIINHKRTLHGGPQFTLSSIQQKFWIIGSRAPIRSFIHRCVTCARQRAVTCQQLIGQLPVSRVTSCRPFLHTGVDYAGPLTLKTFRGRGSTTYKGYFIIFVCFSTSAIHLEVATDFSTDVFLAAYKRVHRTARYLLIHYE